MFVLGPNPWAEGGDKRFAPGKHPDQTRATAMSPWSSTTPPAMSFWRIGPDYPADRTRSPPKIVPATRSTRSVAEHDVHMIPEGRPGGWQYSDLRQSGRGRLFHQSP